MESGAFGGQSVPDPRAETLNESDPGYIPPFLLDLPTADPSILPAATLDPDTIRQLRDREDPITAHRTRRNR
jgi:hypothetical protein